PGSVMRSDLICRIEILSSSSPNETGTEISDMGTVSSDVGAGQSSLAPCPGAARPVSLRPRHSAPGPRDTRVPGRWQSGGMYLTRNQAGVYSASGVRIPPSPPDPVRAPAQGACLFQPRRAGAAAPVRGSRPAGTDAMRHSRPRFPCSRSRFGRARILLAAAYMPVGKAGEDDVDARSGLQVPQAG